ncbi:MAG: DUF1997 domain-containing protein [Cyanobacteriota bacterium]|nr:DUF1997 domain-containing protein [Cyanobacteriota bacterium]
MADPAPTAGAPAGLPVVKRHRHLLVPITAAGASRERLEAYLGLVDRPLTALLARERLRRDAPGRFTYRSNPHRILQREVVPTLGLAARWEANRLEVRSTRCQLVGLGSWGEAMGFTLAASLAPREALLTGWAEVAIHSRMMSMGPAKGLAGLALESVLDRIERRLARGLHKDAVAWLEEADDREAFRG